MIQNTHGLLNNAIIAHSGEPAQGIRTNRVISRRLQRGETKGVSEIPKPFELLDILPDLSKINNSVNIS